ncbi:MAG: linear amide C-N hydrolase [Bacteroidales bacterium]|nr:linear amide C-N hydrolase [Bacteroidales bacterium]
MIKKLISLGIILFILATIQQVNACSTFCLKDSKNLVFGRSYDWNIGYGYMMTNLRNVKKTRFLPYDEKLTTWTSKYGSVTINQYGKEYPIGGMNEMGLVIDVMTLKDTYYPNPDERSAIDELGWVQYQLDNSASIQDVIESNKTIRISNKTFVKLHFLVSDASGRTLAVEFLNGVATFHYDENLPYKCLTNSTYDNSLVYLKNLNGFSGQTPVDYEHHISGNSLERFAICADMLNKYKEDINTSIIDYSFDILNKVKDDVRSQFQIVYDLKNKEIHFRSLQSSNIKMVKLSSFNFDCTSKPMMIDVNTTSDGNIFNKFSQYDSTANRELVIKSYRETGIKLPENIILKIARWPENLKCSQ